MKTRTISSVFFLVCFFGLGSFAGAQHTVRFIVKSDDSTLQMAGTTVVLSSNKQKAGTSDSTGLVTIYNIPEGKQEFIFSHTGFLPRKVMVTVPVEEIILVEMESAEEEEEAVIVMSTRSSRTIYDIPTRVEIISGEELEEKSNMKPGDIRMMLNESTGIQTQQTSATSYNSSIRIQGLDGRYTQLLRDGYPLYGGFSGGLSLLQITPLDLKQVEVIKGSVSTLYGGGAIAGMVNLVSKTPGKERELNFLANGTSAAGLDLSAFYTQKFSKTGLTIFGSANHGAPYDPSGIGFTAIPKFDRYTVHPRLFIYGKSTNMDLGIQLMSEDRLGGDINFVKDKSTTGYFESNTTKRVTANWGVDHTINDQQKLSFKSSYSYFNRSIGIPLYNFAGTQKTFFSELNYVLRKTKTLWIAGINFSSDAFAEKTYNNVARDYEYSIPGIFIQNNYEVSEKLSFETGLRTDFTKESGVELLPRMSILYEPGPRLTFRAGGGKGYKVPGLFMEETERILFRNVMPLHSLPLVNERSAGGNLDINYRTGIGSTGITINQLFYYTRINHPLTVEKDNSSDDYYVRNFNYYIDTKGIETNLRVQYRAMKIFIGYTYTDANINLESDKLWLALTARHRLNNVLMFEKENNFKIGLEGYYFSKQKLNDGASGKSYWIFGIMAEKIFEKFSVFLNFENISDTRQTKFDSIYTGSFQSPVFRDVYAPLDGFVVNGGLKIKL
jgi:outer membrane receptor for ferrienterochelin and colicins